MRNDCELREEAWNKRESQGVKKEGEGGKARRPSTGQVPPWKIAPPRSVGSLVEIR